MVCKNTFQDLEHFFNTLYGVTCICVSGRHVCRSQAVPSVLVYCEWTSMPFYMSAGAGCDLLHSPWVWWWAVFGKKISHFPEVACLVDAVLQAWLGGMLDASDTASAFLLFCTNSYIKNIKKVTTRIIMRSTPTHCQMHSLQSYIYKHEICCSFMQM